MTTRIQVANYLATKLPTDRQHSLRQAAAWLIATRRDNEADYLARDVAIAAAHEGYLWARITTARSVTPATRQAIEAYLYSTTGATALELELVEDVGVIGGVRVETAAAELDATLRTGLQRLVKVAVA